MPAGPVETAAGIAVPLELFISVLVYIVSIMYVLLNVSACTVLHIISLRTVTMQT